MRQSTTAYRPNYPQNVSQSHNILEVLKTTAKPVKLIARDRVVAWLSPQDAMRLVDRYPERYEMGGNKNRVRLLRDLLPDVPIWIAEFQYAWRNGGAACLQPSYEWLRSRESHGVCPKRA